MQRLVGRFEKRLHHDDPARRAGRRRLHARADHPALRIGPAVSDSSLTRKDDSKRLATIDREIPLDVDFDALVVAPPDRSTMKELFRTLEFRALLKRVDELEEALPGAPPSEPSDQQDLN